MDQIKEAFTRVKEDMKFLENSIEDIKKELSQIQLSILNLIKNQNLDKQTHSSTQPLNNKTIRQMIATDKPTSTDNSTDIYHFKAFKGENIGSSIGNKGVSTDRQTDRQTDNLPKSFVKTEDKQVPNTTLLLNQLDDVKKDLRLKIKKLTNQEMLVFSAIYQFTNEGKIVDYPLLSTSLKLSESSIRDYIQRIVIKGLPLNKEKLNNKKVILTISEDFKKLASLNTLMELRKV